MSTRFHFGVEISCESSFFTSSDAFESSAGASSFCVYESSYLAEVESVVFESFFVVSVDVAGYVWSSVKSLVLSVLLSFYYSDSSFLTGSGMIGLDCACL